MDQQDLTQLTNKYYAGETSLQEEQLLSDQLSSTETAAPSDEATQALFLYAQHRKTELPPASLTQKLEALHLAPPNPYRIFLRIAAALVITTGIGWLIFDKTTTQERVSVISAKEITSATLPDGTRVWLNTASVLEYTEDDATRHVLLTGEAYFEVARSSAHPSFVIDTDSASTTVTGTAFNLRNYTGEHQIELTVFEGSVRFGTKKDVDVAAGKQAAFNRETHTVIVNDALNPNATAWKNHKLIFANTSLSDFLRDLERYFHKHLQLQTPSSGAYHHITCEFTRPDLEEALSLIDNLLDGHHRCIQDTCYITVKPAIP